MAKAFSIVLDKGWKNFLKALDASKFDQATRKTLRRASKLNGAVAQRAIRKQMRNGRFAANAPLTVHIKASTKPLIGGKGGGQMFQSITWKLVDDFTVFAGVLRSNQNHNIAQLLHDGGVIKVTTKMRMMFWILHRTSIGRFPASKLRGRARTLWDKHPGDWKPLNKDTVAIIIPKRPWIKEAFKTSALKKRAKQNWEEAVEAAMGIVARGKK